jgi:hypothetical protein
MIYKVRATFIEERLGDFFEKLTDGTIEGQRPDGEEIVASMKRAKFTTPGIVEWFEMCLCPTPLLHERKTHYDFHFSEIATEPVEDYGEIEGTSFWSFMESIKIDKGKI